MVILKGEMTRRRGSLGLGGLQEYLDDLTRAMYGRERSVCQGLKMCVCCGKPAVIFKNVVSRKEYAISALCEQCQDERFV